jgi:nucleoside-diphosphate-sugar epimerase
MGVFFSARRGRATVMLGRPRLNFARMDIRDDHALIERLIADADVVLPLAAYAGQPTTCAPPPATAPG